MPLVPSKTTAISDAILAASCIWGLYALQGTGNHLAKIWFSLTLVASGIGFVRFCKSTDPNSLIRYIRCNRLSSPI